jgi:phosphoribosylformylglycinamidine synthase subunit PurS
MKARVYVTMKLTVLDPQGQAVQRALNGLGHKEIASVRQGKYFEIGLAKVRPRTRRRSPSTRLREMCCRTRLLKITGLNC